MVKKKRADGKVPTIKLGLQQLYERYYFGRNCYSIPNTSPESLNNEINNKNTRNILAAENILAFHYEFKGETFHAYKNMIVGNYTAGAGDESSNEESQAKEV